MPARLSITCALVPVLLLGACAQTPNALRDRDNLSTEHAQITSDVVPAQAEQESVVIYVYPQDGPVSAGQYYRLPLEQDER